MSVVTQQSRRRWSVVAAGVAVLLCLPAATSAATSWIRGRDETRPPEPSVLLQRALASARVPHSGLARSTGSLGLPDLPQFSDLAAILGGSTRTRVWWAGPGSWRVDVLSPTGEQGIYADGDRTVRWDYEQSRLTEVVGTSGVRLPRADDLLPPQATRRLLAGVGPDDRVEALPGVRSIAGLQARGVRIVPADRRSTIGRIEVWLDPGRGLPVAIDVIDAAGTTALQSSFVELDLADPAPSVLRVPAAPGAVHDRTDAPDLVARLQRFQGRWLPDTLAGVAASEPVIGSTATYGTGLIRFVVLPLPGRLGGQVLEAARTGGGVEAEVQDGEVLQVNSGLINLVVVRAPSMETYLVAGLVSEDLLTDAAEALLLQADGRLG